jgi:hypothetical protein
MHAPDNRQVIPLRQDDVSLSIRRTIPAILAHAMSSGRAVWENR